MKRRSLLSLLICCGLISMSNGPKALAADGITVDGHLRVGGKPVMDAVIWLEAPAAPRPARRAILDQRDLAFSPTILAISTGSTVRFPNNDRVLHNVFSFRDGKKFDLGLYPVGQVRDVTFDHAGVSRLFCNIHPGMAAYVVAVDSPYYAVTDKRGAFSLVGVPPGQYTYHAWRAGAATASGKLTIVANESLEVQWPVN
jgi:plastocyanin